MKKIISWAMALVMVLMCSIIISSCDNTHTNKIPEGLIFPVQDLSTGKMGYMDLKGNIVLDPIYLYGGEFDTNTGIAMVTDAGRGWKLIDRRGNTVFSNRDYLAYYPTTNTVIAGSQFDIVQGVRPPYEQLVGYYKLDGTQLLPEEYVHLSSFVNGKAVAQKKDYRWYIIDPSGNVVKQLDDSIKLVQHFSSGYCAFTRDGDGKDPSTSMGEFGYGHWGYLDPDGNILFEIPGVTRVTDFEFGRAIINIWCGKAYIVDLTGRAIADIGNDAVNWYRFLNGVAYGCAEKNGKRGYGSVDLNGNWIIDPIYQSITCYGEIATAMIDNNHFVLLNEKGETLFESNFPSTYFKYGYFFILRNDEFYMLDIKGNTVLQLPKGFIPFRGSMSRDWQNWRFDHLKNNDK